ncbi:hypothetical protein EYM_00750 [Ignicoccus islandicus DSM 13165]|uniref:Molybdate ABC transporter substrate-binding protein n=1 Tax=Ignicoccus islandicus DSM 13165 TaxID=940295 RepID=A0A0U3E2J0_9CREN|nr:molybdate ABC transporter substrate-binding protein [Ignicoccus islandicus]ALU12139.1 hypothetical protein EYM_00750 [Ignicoccus islandicus DSM 13165]
MRSKLIAAFVILALMTVGLSHLSFQRNEKPLFLLNAAMKKAWLKILPLFEKKYNVQVEAIYGSSGHLLAQLEITKTGEVYSPATPVYMEKAVRDGVVDPNTVTTVACLRLAILVPANSPIRSLDDLVKGNYKVAMCDLKSCAVGKFAKQSFEMSGLWNQLRGKVITFTENFSKLVSLVALGQVDAAIGWSVGHYWYPDKVRAIPLNVSTPYEPCIQIAITKYAKNRDLAAKFIQFLKEPEVQQILKELGYEVVNK